MSKRIDTSGGESFGTNPFDSLSTGLPKGTRHTELRNEPDKQKKTSKKGRVEVRREKNGRGGKTVTTLTAFATHIPLSDLERLVLEMKKTCASGGTLEGRTIELQGDVRERVCSN